MKKEIVQGSLFVQFIDDCAQLRIFEGSFFLRSFFSAFSRFFAAPWFFFIALFFAALAGLFLYKEGFTLNNTAYILTLFALILLALRSPKIALFLFFVTIPIHYTAGIDIGRSTLRLAHVFGMVSILAISYYLFIHEKKETIMKRLATPIDIPLFLLFIIMTISIIQTIYVPNNPPINLNRIYNYPWIKGIVKLLLVVVTIGVFYALQALLQTKEDIKKWLTRYITISIIVALYGLFAFLIYVTTNQYVAIDGYNAIVDIPDDLPRIKATEQEPSFFGFYLITIIPILLALIIRQRKEGNIFYATKPLLYHTNFLIISTVIMVLALFLSGSRSSILAFLFSGITLFFLSLGNQTLFQFMKKKSMLFWFKIKQSQTKKVIAISFLCFILSILVLMVVYWDEIKYASFLVTEHHVILPAIIEKGILAPTIGTFNANYGKFWSTKTRLITIGYALDAFQQHPWLGVGYENYNFYTGTKTYLGLLDNNITWPEVNNYPLKILAEQGIMGFLAFLFFVAVFFYSLFSARKKTNDPFLKALLDGYIATFVGIGVILLFTSNITKPYLWVTMAFAVAGIKLVYVERVATEETEKR